MFLIAVFLGFLLYQVAQVFIGAVIVVIRGFLAVFPGGSRQAWLNSLFQVAIAAVLVGVYIWALTVYMWLLERIIAAIPAGLIQLGSIVAGVLILAATFTFWRMRKAGKSIGERIAKALGRTGLAKDTPERKPSTFGSTVGSLGKQAASKAIDMHQRSKMFRAATTGAKVAATIGTGGTGGIAAKVGTGLVAKAATTKAMMAASRSAASRKAVDAASRAADANGSAPNATQPQNVALPAGVGAAEPAAELGGSVPAGGLEAAASPEGRPASPLAARGETSQEVALAGRQQGMNAGNGVPAAPQPQAGATRRISHIPEGNYGGTWVHKNGQAHRPVTITPDGRPVRNVPSEEKITRGFRSGDSWVISPGVRPSPRSAAAAPSQRATTQAHSPTPTRTFPNPRPMQSRSGQGPTTRGGAE